MFSAEVISYKETGCFSRMVIDYIEGAESLKSFYAFPPTPEGITEAIKVKASASVNRKLLVEVLKEQYRSLPSAEAVSENINSLLSPHTFTICTAHQPNLLTGPLYFIYKIIHAISLAAELKKELPQYHFVPVYYMGCEDADLEELNHLTVSGKKYLWDTRQKGAVGRMKVDPKLTSLVAELEGQIGVDAYGKELIALFRSCYAEGVLIQQATARLVHHLFGKWGLIVLNPDNNRLKETVLSLFHDDIFQQVPSRIVSATSERLGAAYKIQAHPREINLFYLKDNVRQRIIKTASGFTVHDTDIHFSEEDLKKELQSFPERFSPNVILRGLFQETILPNVAFIGGGGELAYWLQLKDLFDHYKVPFPVQVLRNSFLIIEKKHQPAFGKLGIAIPEIFKSHQELLDGYINKSGKAIHLNGEVQKIESLYNELSKTASAVDKTLATHVAALKAKSLQQLTALENKMHRAERKKHDVIKREISRTKAALFPNGGLQERIENFSAYYALWGENFIEALLHDSPALANKFIVLKESEF